MTSPNPAPALEAREAAFADWWVLQDAAQVDAHAGWDAGWAAALEWVAGEAEHWTEAESGHTNSSAEFKRLVIEVERLIRSEAHALIAGRADVAAQMIMAQLAHKHHLVPASLLRQEGGGLDG